MEPLLFLSHRVPFPPNKGDKLRSYHLLRFLAGRYRIFLGTFDDNPDDEIELASLRELCEDCMVVDLHPGHARLRSLVGLVTGEALTLPYYRDAALSSWVHSIVRRHRISKALVFSSAMAQYVEDLPALTRVVDFVDVDSQKWVEYAKRRSWPLSLLYRREGARLLAFDCSVAGWADASVFVTSAEATLFRRLAPTSSASVHVIRNGVDAHFFSPEHDLPSPFRASELPIVLTGAMDYWPNIDAAHWFAAEVLPLVRLVQPMVRFYVVGHRPVASLQALNGRDQVVVTGGVPDVRPYLKHAHLVVAPLRIARGVQNKILEAMAMAKATVVSETAARGIAVTAGAEVDVASGAEDYARKILALLESPRALTMGRAARAKVLAEHDWRQNLSYIDELLMAPPTSLRGTEDPTDPVARSLTAV